MTASDPTTYRRSGAAAVVTLDDGKANVMTEPMMRSIHKGLDRAEADGAAVVVLAGRPGLFSAGYDRGMFGGGAETVARTVKAGGELVHRIFSSPRPVVAACTGHAIAQGAFLLLAADVRVGATGPFKLGLNEVAIGLTIPWYGIEIARHRLTAPWFDYATGTGSLYPPEDALAAGFLDRVVDEAEVVPAAEAEAERLAGVDAAAHAATKLRARGPALEAIRAGLDTEFQL